MFVAVINRGNVTERVFASNSAMLCKVWATQQAEEIFGRDIRKYIDVDETYSVEGCPITVSVLKSERE